MYRRQEETVRCSHRGVGGPPILFCIPVDCTRNACRRAARKAKITDETWGSMQIVIAWFGQRVNYEKLRTVPCVLTACGRGTCSSRSSIDTSSSELVKPDKDSASFGFGWRATRPNRSCPNRWPGTVQRKRRARSKEVSRRTATLSQRKPLEHLESSSTGQGLFQENVVGQVITSHKQQVDVWHPGVSWQVKSRTEEAEAVAFEVDAKTSVA